LSSGLHTCRHFPTWATPLALFCAGHFQDRVSQTICPGCLQSMIILISAFWVAGITGVCHQHSACHSDTSYNSWLGKEVVSYAINEDTVLSEVSEVWSHWPKVTQAVCGWVHFCAPHVPTFHYAWFQNIFVLYQWILYLIKKYDHWQNTNLSPVQTYGIMYSPCGEAIKSFSLSKGRRPAEGGTHEVADTTVKQRKIQLFMYTAHPLT
jgi:hypothetical protein